MKRWTGQDRKLLERLYPTTKNVILADVFGVTEGAIISKAHVWKLRKTPEFMAECAKAGQFPKGHVPANKGKKMPYNANSARTQFKKGHVPHTAVSVGTEVIDAEGYLKRKVSDRKDIPARRNWKYVHQIVWEQHHGEIPEKHIVVFKNGDRTDIRIENLDCISMAENANRNRERYPDELKQISQLIGALNRQIRMRDE